MHKRSRNKLELADTNRVLQNLTIQKRHASRQQDRDAIQQQIAIQQQKISQIQENRYAASEIRIDNYYKTNIGKNIPVTYRTIRDRPSDRQIQSLL